MSDFYPKRFAAASPPILVIRLNRTCRAPTRLASMTWGDARGLRGLRGSGAIGGLPSMM